MSWLLLLICKITSYVRFLIYLPLCNILRPIFNNYSDYSCKIGLIIYLVTLTLVLELFFEGKNNDEVY